mgnify:CR=1 FL=1
MAFDSQHSATLSPGYRLLGGRAFAGSQPFNEQCRDLKSQGITYVISFTGKDDNVEATQRASVACNINWRWMPFTQTLDCTDAEQAMMWEYLHEMRQLLIEGESLYMHCDEANKRCGLMFFALCHACSLPSANAYPALISQLASQAHSLPRAELQWAASLGTSLPY